MKSIFFSIYLVIAMLLASCSEGLAPPEPTLKKGPAFIKGTIVYKGGKDSWLLDKDSAYAIRAAAFTQFPLPDSAGIVNELLNGRAFISGFTSLPTYVDSSNFEIQIPEAPATIKYIGIAKQISVDLNAQKVVGIYTLSGDNTQPTQLEVQPGDTTYIRIEVDFASLPPQPF
jgi:hypothetical protein